MTASTTELPPAPRTGRARLRSRLTPQAAIPLVLLLLALATVFPSGNDRGQFYRDWGNNVVTANHLAVAENLSPKHGFLGVYSFTLDGQGDLSYRPYNRFPIGGYVLLKLAMSPFGDDFSSKIHAARTLMLAFFVLNAVLAYLALCRLAASRWVALAATLMAFSSLPEVRAVGSGAGGSSAVARPLPGPGGRRPAVRRGAPVVQPRQRVLRARRKDSAVRAACGGFDVQALRAGPRTESGPR